MGQLQRATKSYQPGIVRADIKLKSDLTVLCAPKEIYQDLNVFIHEVSFNVVVGKHKLSTNIQIDGVE